MVNELWDLSRACERMAIAMWRGEAERGRAFGVAKRRTPLAFKGESEETREKWLSMASDALDALLVGECKE